MNQKRYCSTIQFFKDNKTAYIVLKIIYKYLPWAMFISYPALLVYSFFALRGALLKLVLVPLGVLVFVSVLRIIINERRPYEQYGVPSLFNKQTNGRSMPSRHTASAFIVAMAFLYVNLPLGIAGLIISVLITVSRVLAGAHYFRDVIAGAAISLTTGVVFFFLI